MADDQLPQDSNCQTRPLSPQCSCHLLQPAPEPDAKGKELIKWWTTYLGAIAGVATFGGGITFSIILSDILDPAKIRRLNPDIPRQPPFDLEQIRTFLANAWVAFVALLGLSSLVSVLLAFDGEFANKITEKQFWKWVMHTVSGMLNGLLVLAFMFLSLAVVSYVEGSGWTAVAITSLFGFVTLCSWLGVATIIAWEGATNNKYGPESKWWECAVELFSGKAAREPTA